MSINYNIYIGWMAAFTYEEEIQVVGTKKNSSMPYKCKSSKL